MSDISVQSVAPAARDKWLSVAGECPCATYFHTPYWYELIAPGQKHIALEATFSDGASALIPIAKIKRAGGLLTDRFSSPAGTYGGWLASAPLREGHVRALLNLLASKKNLTFRVNPFDPSSRFIGGIAGGSANNAKFSYKDDFTRALCLTSGIDKIRGGMSRGHKSAMGFAARNGVTVKQADTPDEWERYCGLYVDSLGRWRAGGQSTGTVYPAGLFKRLYRNRTGNEVLWLAVKDGEPISGALVFYWGAHAVYWHGAASANGLVFKPNPLLFWEIIADAARRGCGIFDFNPSGGHGGAESFKERFGAARLTTPVLQTRTPIRALIARLRAKA